MYILGIDCLFSKVDRETIDRCKPFDCGDIDLNDFFSNDVPAYDKDLMGKHIVGLTGRTTLKS